MLQSANRTLASLLKRLLRWPNKAGRTDESGTESPGGIQLATIPVVTAQLEETVAQVEESVVSICGSFQGMASLARQTVRQASGILGVESEDGGGVATLIETFRATLKQQLDRMDRGSDAFFRAIQHLEEVDTAMQRINRVLAEVDRIAFSNKVMALNAKIQAVHVGELGASFGVVADQISSQACRSSELAEEIAGIAKGLGVAVKGTAAELREVMVTDQQRSQLGREELESALHNLEQSHEGMRRSLAAASESSQKLADDISQAVVALQFQDRVKQRVQHVTEALAALQEAFAEDATPGATVSLAERERKVLDDMRNSYTMASERSVLARETGGTDMPVDEGGDVELF